MSFEKLERRLRSIPGMGDLIDNEYANLLFNEVKSEEIVNFTNYRGQNVRIVKSKNYYDIFVDDTHPQTNCTAEDCIRWLAFSSHKE